MSSWWCFSHNRGGKKKGCGLNPRHQAKMERASDRGMPFSVSMRHAFVPFPGKVTDDSFWASFCCGNGFQSTDKAWFMNKTQKNTLVSPSFLSLVEPVFPLHVARFITVSHYCLHDLLCGKPLCCLLSILLKSCNPGSL